MTDEHDEHDEYEEHDKTDAEAALAAEERVDLTARATMAAMMTSIVVPTTCGSCGWLDAYDCFHPGRSRYVAKHHAQSVPDAWCPLRSAK